MASIFPCAEPGMPLDEVDTPALLIDLDVYEANLRKMADAIAAYPVKLRAHSKTHKCAVIARHQMALGAVGVCAQKVGEAEALVQAGVTNVLVTNQIVGRSKIQRLAALSREAEVAVCCDNAANAQALADGATDAGVTLNVLVEIDCGAGRCGVAPGAEARALAQHIGSFPSLRFAGLQAYHGSAQHVRGYTERKTAVAKSADLTQKTVSLLGEAGIECAMVTGAGTGTFEFEMGFGVHNELQAGLVRFHGCRLRAQPGRKRRTRL